ncbi:PAS domain-containing hybrid sensor histidine kinase/response regulator [Piscinibacter koreensis]|uniref:Virulence sensor protein BvgS n=1 Tax=Piscinibacter koreensis TaxID=2742824 RepID=A0A7Y6TUZ5_9BURK|nr:PAS domain S-box protein [Schlegelella koreensis]NUZ04535.1 PAS domain S-box protein [Schlegelella koreensis]
MSDAPAPMAQPGRADAPLHIIGRACFGTGAWAGVACAAVFATLVERDESAGYTALLIALVVFSAGCAPCWQRSARPGFPLHGALAGVALAAIALAVGVGAVLGDPLRSPSLGACPLVVCLVTAILGWRTGFGMAALALGATALLAGLDTARTGGGESPAQLALLLGLQWIVIACALVGGSLLARVVARYTETVDQRERHFRGLLRMAVDWHWELDADARFTFVSPAGEQRPVPVGPVQLGLRPWEMPGVMVDPERLDEHRADLEGRRPFSGMLMRRRDRHGRSHVHSISGEPRFDAKGTFLGHWGVARDVTDEMRARRGLVASETRYRELFERSPSPLLLHRSGRIFDANPAAARLFGFADAAAMVDVDVAELYAPGESRARCIEQVRRLEGQPAGESVPVSDFAALGRDGRPISVQATSVRVDAADGPATLLILFDITARLAAQAALRRSEAMLRHLFATSPDCITVSEAATGRYALVNTAFERITGYPAAEAVGRTATELGVWHDGADRERLVAALASAGVATDMPTTVRTRSGALVSMRLSAARFEMDRRAYIVANARDVTQAEQTRLEHAAILERASIGIAFTRGGRFVQANPRFERTFGWPIGQLAGQPRSAVWPDAEPEADVGRIAETQLAAGRSFETEREMRRRDGSVFWCRLLAQMVDPQHPVDGGTIWIADDVTERRRIDAALAAARDAAEAANRAKSAFLANTSHEIRTPLNGLLGLARMALQDPVDDAERRRYLEQILESARGLEGILSDILDLSKIEAGKITLEHVAFDLRETLVNVKRSYRSLADVKELALELVVDDALPARVAGDPVRVRQILGNFITNAIKFTDAGTVRIEARPAAAGQIRLAVADTGGGIDAETRRHLWQPFSQGDSSTTRRYGGTGLGLSICRELAELMGGRVGMESAPGRGSTFWADLPLAEAPPSADPVDAAEPAGDEVLAGRRVLLVEDNVVNMMIATATLERWGIEVGQAFDGRMAIGAVEAAVAEGRPFDAVLMDVQMPVLSGHDAALELRRAHPADELPIIALTAAALVGEREQALAAGMNDFLTKPLDPSMLRRTLLRWMTRRGEADVA